VAVGTVTSGCLSPTLEQSIAMAIIDRDACEPGTSVEVNLGRTTVNAKTCKLPFLKK
jgi:glycine cleavage system aminomethyltransferase T